MNQIQKARVAWRHRPQDIAFRVSVCLCVCVYEWVLFVKLNSTMRWLNVKTPHTHTHTHVQWQAHAQIACQRRRSEQRNKVDYNNIAQKARHKTCSQTTRQKSRRSIRRKRATTTRNDNNNCRKLLPMAACLGSVELAALHSVRPTAWLSAPSLSSVCLNVRMPLGECVSVNMNACRK